MPAAMSACRRSECVEDFSATEKVLHSDLRSGNVVGIDVFLFTCDQLITYLTCENGMT